jgi:hypothetical protein
MLALLTIEFLVNLLVYAKEENDQHRRDALLVELRSTPAGVASGRGSPRTTGKSLDDSPTRPQFGCVVSESRFIRSKGKFV